MKPGRQRTKKTPGRVVDPVQVYLVAPVEPLPAFRGGALQPGVDLDDSAALADLMDDGATGVAQSP